MAQCPYNHRSDQNNCSHLAQVLHALTPHVAHDAAGRRNPVRRQFHDEGCLVPAEKDPLEQDGREDRDQDAEQVDRQQYQPLIFRKKCRNQQDVYRQPCATGHERDNQHRQDAVLAAFERAGGHDCRDVASEAHQQRNERLAVQSDLMHQLIHDEGRACHIARIFHQRNEEEQDQDVGQKDDHSPYSADDAVDDQVAQRSFGH